MVKRVAIKPGREHCGSLILEAVASAICTSGTDSPSSSSRQLCAWCWSQDPVFRRRLAQAQGPLDLIVHRLFPTIFSLERLDDSEV